MNTPKIITGLAVIALLIAVSAPGPKQSAPNYAAATEMNVRGVVQDVEEFYCPISLDRGTHLTLKTDNGTMQVHVAPGRFLRGNSFDFAPGDNIEVVGSVVRYKGTDAVIARTINRGNETFAFRNSTGKGAWIE